MASSPQESSAARRVVHAFEFIENAIYVVLGVLLSLAAILFLAYSVVDFVLSFTAAGMAQEIITLLGRLLLVLLIVELLYTVQVSFSAGTLVLEPFLLIGIIAAIRRIFVLTAQFSEVSSERTIEFEHFVIELGALSVLILVIVVALVLLRKSQAKYGQHDDHSSSDPGPG